MILDTENIEKLVAILSNFRELLDSLMDSLTELEHILIAEEKAIQESNLNQIEKIVPSKEKLGSQIEKAIIAVRTQLEQLFQGTLNPEICPKKSNLELSDLVTVLTTIESSMKNLGLASQVFLHIASKVKTRAKKVMQLRVKLLPRIEANSYLVRKLLSYHQETYRFWQSLAYEAESVYSSHGRTKTTKSQSILEVKT